MSMSENLKNKLPKQMNKKQRDQEIKNNLEMSIHTLMARFAQSVANGDVKLHDSTDLHRVYTIWRDYEERMGAGQGEGGTLPSLNFKVAKTFEKHDVEAALDLEAKSEEEVEQMMRDLANQMSVDNQDSF